MKQEKEEQKKEKQRQQQLCLDCRSREECHSFVTAWRAPVPRKQIEAALAAKNKEEAEKALEKAGLPSGTDSQSSLLQKTTCAQSGGFTKIGDPLVVDPKIVGSPENEDPHTVP